MNRIRLKFSNRNGQSITGMLDLPLDEKPFYYALFVHGIGRGGDETAIRSFVDPFVSNGFGILSVPFITSSDGEVIRNLAAEDVEDICSYLNRHYAGPGVLIGHSIGGAAILMAAGKIDSVDSVCVIGAPSGSAYMSRIIKGKVTARGDDRTTGRIVTLGEESFVMDDTFPGDLDAFISKGLTTFRKPLLIVHSPQDKEIGADSAEYLFGAAHHPKNFISLDGSDHLLTNDRDVAYCAGLIAPWAKRYTTPIESKPRQREFETVTRIGDSALRYQVQVLAGRHTLTADEPEDAGGNDTGPSPYQLLGAALGACTAMTLRMYADRKKWDLDAANVYLNHEKRYSDDCLNCEEETSRIDHFDRVIAIKGDLDESQREKLLEIANKCPVHRTLEGDIQINTSLMEEGA